MAKRYYKSEEVMYDDIKNRRQIEDNDSRMISEDRSAVANLPQNVMMKPWPKGGDYLPEPLNDTIAEVNRQLKEDSVVRKSGYRPEKMN